MWKFDDLPTKLQKKKISAEQSLNSLKLFLDRSGSHPLLSVPLKHNLATDHNQAKRRKITFDTGLVELHAFKKTKQTVQMPMGFFFFFF